MLKRWLQTFFDSPLVVGTIQILNKIVLPGFEGHSIFQVGSLFIKGIQQGNLVIRASAISFELILASLPTLLLLISIIPFIPVDNLQEELLNGMELLLPTSSYELIEGTVRDLVLRKHGTVLSLGFLLSLYYSSNSINAVLTGFNASFHLTFKRSPLKQRLLAVLLILVLSILLITAVSLLIFSDFMFDYIRSNWIQVNAFHIALLHIAKWLIILGFFITSYSTLYNAGETTKKKWKWMSVGALTASITSIVTSSIFAYYVSNFGQYNKLYGSVGTIIALLLLINFNSLILLVGFEINASISRAR